MMPHTRAGTRRPWAVVRVEFRRRSRCGVRSGVRVVQLARSEAPEAGIAQDASSRRLAWVKSHLLVFWSAHSSGRRPSRADPVVGGGRPDQGRVDTVTAPSFAESALGTTRGA